MNAYFNHFKGHSPMVRSLGQPQSKVIDFLWHHNFLNIGPENCITMILQLHTNILKIKWTWCFCQLIFKCWKVTSYFIWISVLCYEHCSYSVSLLPAMLAVLVCNWETVKIHFSNTNLTVAVNSLYWFNVTHCCSDVDVYSWVCRYTVTSLLGGVTYAEHTPDHT